MKILLYPFQWKEKCNLRQHACICHMKCFKMHNFYLLLKIMANSENFELDRRSIWEYLYKNPFVPCTPFSGKKNISDFNITHLLCGMFSMHNLDFLP